MAEIAIESPLATYVERRLIGSRTFRLFPSHVELQSPDGKVRFNLHQLLPTPKTGSTIDSTTRYRLWVGFLVMVFLYFFVPGLQPEAVAFLRGHLSPLAFLVARLAYLTTMLILLVLAYFWPKQYDFAAFEYEPGNPAFHLMKLGKGSAEYASFLDLLLKQIAASRKQESTPASCE